MIVAGIRGLGVITIARGWLLLVLIQGVGAGRDGVASREEVVGAGEGGIRRVALRKDEFKIQLH